MSDPLFDNVARTLASPMPRRRAVRMIGAGLLAAGFPFLRPARARGQCGVPCVPPGGGEPVCCEFSFESPQCCNSGTQNSACCPSTATCCPNSSGLPCCDPPARCSSTSPSGCEEPCPGGETPCGSDCCKDDEECIGGRCEVKCPPKRTRCGDQCCPKGHRCAKGKCKECPGDQKACGKKCCGEDEDCCFDERRKICCDTRKRTCCHVGQSASAEGSITCCREDEECARQSSDGSGTVTAESPLVCCPEDRHVPLRGSDTCCPPGYKSLGGQLVIPPGGPGGLCCRADKTCGSGKDITCCASAAGFEERCENGRCVPASGRRRVRARG